MKKQSVDIQFNLIGKASDLLNSIQKVEARFRNMKIEPQIKKGFENQFENLTNMLEKFQQKAANGITTKGEFNSLNKDFNKISKTVDNLFDDLSKLELDPDKLIPKEITKNIKIIIDDYKKLLKTKEDVIKAQENYNKAQERTKEAAVDFTKSQKLKGRRDKKTIESDLKQNEQELKNAGFVSRGNLNNINSISHLKAENEEVKRLLNERKKLLKESEIELTNNRVQQIQTRAAEELRKARQKETEALQNQDEALVAEQFQMEKVSQAIREMGNTSNVTNTNIEELNDSLQETARIDSTKGLDKTTEAMKESVEKTDDLGDSIERLGEKTNSLQGFETLRNRMNEFFSITGAIRVFRTVVRDAYETVKDLDAAMTETAVVTDYTVSDMWDMLDDYTKRANELGATTQGAYETATLYYQQGLNDQETAELSIETMKMARIANMDYAKATDSMTAALRGFNLELNAASAQRVNDVYSKLAAVTASDTQEISTAMEKTASLAHNAGMDLESTAVYLSQALETTREAPENIGTAMKTILARFQALTKDPDSLTPDVKEALEGETIDANVTEAALRKAGVALRDETGQFRDAKDIMLELNTVWDTLDKNTQRYIATQTAGARQQSNDILTSAA